MRKVDAVMLLVVMLCFSGLAGHIYDMDVLYRWDAGTVTEKKATSVALSLLSISAWLSFYARTSKHLAFDLFCFTISVMACSTVWLSWILLPNDGPTEPYTVRNGLPSVGTAVFVTMICLSVVIYFRMWSMLFAVVAIVGAVVALLGYWLDNPLMYYYRTGSGPLSGSTAMAISTAIKILVLGSVSLYGAARYGKAEHQERGTVDRRNDRGVEC